MFRWLRKRNEAKRQFMKDVAAAEAAPRLHGVNLVDWAYLGRTIVAYTNDLGRDEATVFSFCLRNDTDKRKFVVMPRSKYTEFDRHPWVMEHAALWKIGERELWATVANEPSRWLQEHMLERFNEVWCHETNWWIKKGTQPKKKPKLELVKDATTDNNVVKLDFKGKKKEEDPA